MAAGTAVAWAAPQVLTVDVARAATVAPFTGAVLLAGTNQSWLTQDAAGNLRTSADGGDTWTTPAGGIGYVATALAVAPANFATTDEATFLHSADAGSTWVAPVVAPSSPPVLLAQQPTVVVDGAGLVSFTADAGVNWAAAVQPSAPLTVLGGSGTDYVGYSSTNVAWYFSTDSGASWAAGSYLAFEPTTMVGGGGNFVATGTGLTAYSNDQGNSWTLVSGLTFVPTLLVGSDLVFLATDGAAWAKSVNGGSLWTAGIGPSFVPTLLAGYGPGVFVATDGTTNWARTIDVSSSWLPVTTPPS